MKPSLFLDNKDENYTADGLQLDHEASALFRPLFDKYVSKGFKAREIEYIISATVRDVSLETLIGWKQNETIKVHGTDGVLNV